jgi:hypothetical protein
MALRRRVRRWPTGILPDFALDPAATLITDEAMSDQSLSDDRVQLDIREKLAHIDLMLAQHDRVRQEIRLAPLTLLMSGMTAGAAFLAAGFALAKLFA